MKGQSVNLDILRASAVLLVLFVHFIDVLGLKDTPFLKRWGIDAVGHFGVLIFFIHTSFVLMASLERLSAEGGNTTARFYIRRIFRIYPLSVVTIVLLLAFRIPTYFEPTYQWLGWPIVTANLFLVQNVGAMPSVTGPLWSLPFEVQMYILLPFAYLMARRIRTLTGSVALFAGGCLLWWLESHLARAVGYPPLLTYVPWFSLGIAAWTISNNVMPSWSAKSYLLCLPLFIAGPSVAFRMIRDYRTGWAILGIGVLFAGVLPRFHDVTEPLVRRTARTIAKYSYGIYLSHVAIMWISFRALATRPQLVQWAVCCPLLVALPFVLYHLVESPMIQLGARLAEKLSPGAARDRRLNVSVAAA